MLSLLLLFFIFFIITSYYYDYDYLRRLLLLLLILSFHQAFYCWPNRLELVRQLWLLLLFITSCMLALGVLCSYLM